MFRGVKYLERADYGRKRVGKQHCIENLGTNPFFMRGIRHEPSLHWCLQHGGVSESDLQKLQPGARVTLCA